VKCLTLVDDLALRVPASFLRVESSRFDRRAIFFVVGHVPSIIISTRIARSPRAGAQPATIG
jgi:hypothetical protein